MELDAWVIAHENLAAEFGATFAMVKGSDALAMHPAVTPIPGFHDADQVGITRFEAANTAVLEAVRGGMVVSKRTLDRIDSRVPAMPKKAMVWAYMKATV